jgi:hypothetical protein
MTNTTHDTTTRFQGHLIRFDRTTRTAEDLGDLRHEFRLAPFEEILVEWHEAMDVDSIEADDHEARRANYHSEQVINSWDRRSPLAFTVWSRTSIDMFCWWPEVQTRRPSEVAADVTAGIPGLGRAAAWLAEVTR